MGFRDQASLFLRNAGYAENREGIFESVTNRRVIAMLDVAPDATIWAEKLTELLRISTFRSAPAWSRYLVLILSTDRTAEFSAAASSFCRDVSKCRRLIAFSNQQPSELFPFVGLPAGFGPGATSVQNADAIVRAVLGSGELTSEFLDTRSPLIQVQKLAEELEDPE